VSSTIDVIPFNTSGGSPALTGLVLALGSSGAGLVRCQKRRAAGRPTASSGHPDLPLP